MEETNQIVSHSLKEIGELIRKKVISPVELVERTFKRMDEIDPHINAFITVDKEQIMQDAKRAEKEINEGNYKGPLHGIPIGLKDMIYTKETRTTMGSEIFDQFIPEEDAFVVQKLKEAGAIITGKQNTHQFAYGPTGDRSFYGPVRNPYDTTKMTGGSSSGSAAAVATGMNFGALGTDTGGSVRIPASFCGIVAMKPTYGRISKNSIFPLSWNLDHVGPMTRTVEDNVLLLNAIQGYDINDPNAIKVDSEDFSQGLKDGIKGIKIGIPRAFFYEHVHPEITENVNKQIETLKELGAIVQDVSIQDIAQYYDAQRTILCSDAYALHKERLEQYPDNWDDEVKERLYTAVDVMGYEYSHALQTRQLIKRRFEETLEEVDVLLTPTVPILPINIDSRHVDIDKYNEEHIRWSILKLTSPTNLTGLPSLSVPSGFSQAGLPIGVQFIGRDFSEAFLYRVGYALEQALKIPTFKQDINMTHKVTR